MFTCGVEQAEFILSGEEPTPQTCPRDEVIISTYSSAVLYRLFIALGVDAHEYVNQVMVARRPIEGLNFSRTFDETIGEFLLLTNKERAKIIYSMLKKQDEDSRSG